MVGLPMQVTPFFTALLRGIRSVVSIEPFHLVLEENGQSAWKRVEDMAGGGLTGLLILSRTLDADEKASLKRHSIPYVVIDGYDDQSHCLFMNTRAGALKAAVHLWNQGVRRPAYVGNPIPAFGTQRDRWLGFAEFWHNQGVEVRPKLLPVDGSSEDFMAKGYEATQELLAEGQIPDGLFYYCDEMALGGLRALREAKLHIPVVGCDGWAAGAYFGLTTLLQPAEQMGREGVRLLLDLMAGRIPPEPCHKISYSAELIIRKDLE